MAAVADSAQAMAAPLIKKWLPMVLFVADGAFCPVFGVLGIKWLLILVLLFGGLLCAGKSLYHKLITFRYSSIGLHCRHAVEGGSGVVECLEERFECGHVRIKVLLVIPPTADRRSVKRLLHVGMGR